MSLINWNEGFRRIRYAFFATSWLIFIAFQFIADHSAAQVGEYSVYMLVFTVCTVLFARGCIWVVRGFIRGASEIKG